jgi:hypothetical protein
MFGDSVHLGGDNKRVYHYQVCTRSGLRRIGHRQAPRARVLVDVIAIDNRGTKWLSIMRRRLLTREVAQAHDLSGILVLAPSSTMRWWMTQGFTRPWKISMTLYKLPGEESQLLDFKCVEFVDELMYGKYRNHPHPSDP